jgi:hypothetical protein
VEVRYVVNKNPPEIEPDEGRRRWNENVLTKSSSAYPNYHPYGAEKSVGVPTILFIKVCQTK